DEIGFQYNKALALDKLGNYSEEASVLRRSVETHPECAVCWNMLGLALAKLESFNEAMDAYDKAIMLDSDYLDPWINRGISLMMGHDDYIEALKSFDKAIDIDPNCME